MQCVAVGKTRQRIIFGEIFDTLRLALADRNIAQDRTVLEAIRSLPAREAGFNGKSFAVLAPALELDDDGAARNQKRLARGVAHGKGPAATIRLPAPGPL